MGSKNNPGKFDCYSKAEPDEPMFVLLGRDPAAGVVVRMWEQVRRWLGETEPEVLAEALQCAEAMGAWAERLGRSPVAETARLRNFGERMLAWFEFGHLPPHLQEASMPFAQLALHIVATTDPGPERTVALRKLLEAKDAAVRAKLVPGG